MSTKQIEVNSLASIANFSPGFDVFGIVIEDIGDVLYLEVIPEPEIEISIKGVDSAITRAPGGRQIQTSRASRMCWTTSH